MEALQEIVPKEKIRLNQPLEKYTSFRIGGPADCLVEVGGAEQLRRLKKYAETEGIPFFILGNGSNLLADDQGFRGIVLHIGSSMNEIRITGNTITARAGALLSQVARAALEHGLTGLEFASGIPGSIGGGVVMNAGAYGGELGQVVESVTVLDEEGKELELSNARMEFGYRTSAVKRHPYIVTEVRLQLRPGDPEQIRERMEDLAGRRREKQPLEFPSAGSTFKRPEGYFAGELIMKAGLRGLQIGGARVSDKHCGFVINAGNATAADVKELMKVIQDRVKEEFGVKLEPEVILMGGEA